MKDIFICYPKRTAIGSFQGSLSSLTAIELGVKVVEEITKDFDKSLFEQIIAGCVLTAGLGQAPARQVAIKSGLDLSIDALTINKVCSSGLKAVMLAAEQILLGKAQAVIAGGMESMSNCPYILPKLRTGGRLGHVEAIDLLIHDGLWDVYNNFHMGNCAELCASEFGFSREEQDEFAKLSYTRAIDSINSGLFCDEIVPIEIKNKRESLIISSDEEPLRGKIDKFSTLNPAFKKDGTVTAANASSINDGASFMIVCSENFLKRNKLEPIARIVSQATYSADPERFTTAPIGAINKLLDKSQVKIEEIDLFEVNEAFSVVALACQKQLNLPQAKLNIRGGSVSLGHPIGASGARILCTLLYALKAEKKKTGVAAICNGGGEATALLVESC